MTRRETLYPGAPVDPLAVAREFECRRQLAGIVRDLRQNGHGDAAFYLEARHGLTGPDDPEAAAIGVLGPDHTATVLHRE